MKTTAVIWFSLFCFGINLQQGFGQCEAQMFYIDNDGDGFGNLEYTDRDFKRAWELYKDFDEIDIPFGNVIVSCCRPFGYAFSPTDFDDEDPCITNISPQHFYLDNDGDGYGNASISAFCSRPPTGYVSTRSDCDDGDASINPNNVWYQDVDGDGVGGSISQQACVQPLGYVSSSGDACDNNSETLIPSRNKKTRKAR